MIYLKESGNLCLTVNEIVASTVLVVDPNFVLRSASWSRMKSWEFSRLVKDICSLWNGEKTLMSFISILCRRSLFSPVLPLRCFGKDYRSVDSEQWACGNGWIYARRLTRQGASSTVWIKSLRARLLRGWYQGKWTTTNWHPIWISSQGRFLA